MLFEILWFKWSSLVRVLVDYGDYCKISDYLGIQFQYYEELLNYTNRYSNKNKIIMIHSPFDSKRTTFYFSVNAFPFMLYDSLKCYK